MALSVAPLPSMPALDLFGGRQLQDDNIGERVLAALAAQIGGQLLGNAVTHMTGSDRTFQAQQEGLEPPETRNFAQRLFGDQMSQQELEEARTGFSNRENETLRTTIAQDELTRRNQQSELDRAQQDAQLAQTELADVRRMGQDDRQFRAAQGQQQNQFLQGLVKQESDAVQQVTQQNQAREQQQGQFDLGLLEQQAGDLRSAVAQESGRLAERPVRRAQINAANAGAYRDVQAGLGQEIENRSNQELALEQMVQKLIGTVPGVQDPSRVAMVRQLVQKYLATDSTPTEAEFTQFRTAPPPAAPSAPGQPAATAAPEEDSNTREWLLSALTGLLGGTYTPATSNRSP